MQLTGGACACVAASHGLEGQGWHAPVDSLSQKPDFPVTPSVASTQSLCREPVAQEEDNEVPEHTQYHQSSEGGPAPSQAGSQSSFHLNNLGCSPKATITVIHGDDDGAGEQCSVDARPYQGLSAPQNGRGRHYAQRGKLRPHPHLQSCP